MNSRRNYAVAVVMMLSLFAAVNLIVRAQGTSAENKVITEADCSAEKLGTSIPVTSIGEPVAGVTLAAPRWVPAGNVPAYCSIDGVMAPVDKSAYGRPINFRVVLPSSWRRRSAQSGGGGFNGTIPNLTGGEMAGVLRQGFA